MYCTTCIVRQSRGSLLFLPFAKAVNKSVHARAKSLCETGSRKYLMRTGAGLRRTRFGRSTVSLEREDEKRVEASRLMQIGVAALGCERYELG